FSEYARLVDVVCEWLLNIDVLAELHGSERLHGVVVVRRRDRHGVDVLVLLVKHFPEVLVVFGLREVFYRTCCTTVIDVAKEGDLGLSTLGKASDVTVSLSTHSDACNVKRVAGCAVTVTEYKARNDCEGSRSHRGRLNEFPAGHILSLRCIILLHNRYFVFRITLLLIFGFIVGVVPKSIQFPPFAIDDSPSACSRVKFYTSHSLLTTHASSNFTEISSVRWSYAIPYWSSTSCGTPS